MTTPPRNPVDLMCEKLWCSQADLARALGVSPKVISVWRKRGAVPVRMLADVAALTGLPPHLLNPKIPALIEPKEAVNDEQH